MTPPPQLREQIVHGCQRPHAALAATRRIVLVRLMLVRSTGLSITAFTTLLLSASAGIEMGVTLVSRIVGVVGATVEVNKSVRRLALKSSFWTETVSLVVVVVVAVVGFVYATSFSESDLASFTIDCWTMSFCSDFCLFGTSNSFPTKYFVLVSFHRDFFRLFSSEGRYLVADNKRSPASGSCVRKKIFFFNVRRSCSHFLWCWNAGGEKKQFIDY